MIRKWTTYICAVLLVVTGVMKIISIGDGLSAREFIMTFYFLCVAVIIVLVEIGHGAS